MYESKASVVPYNLLSVEEKAARGDSTHASASRRMELLTNRSNFLGGEVDP